MRDVPLSAWRSYLDGETLQPGLYRAEGFRDFVSFLLDGRCDNAQISMVYHLGEVLQSLKPFKPTLLRLHGDMVQRPRQTNFGRALILVESGWQHAKVQHEKIQRASSGNEFASNAISTYGKAMAALKALVKSSGRLVVEPCDQDSAIAKYMMNKIVASMYPFIDVYFPKSDEVFAAVDEVISALPDNN
jgi:hypothetical protein